MKQTLSISRYLMSWGLLFAAIFFTVNIISVVILSDAATRGLARKRLHYDMRQVTNELKSDTETIPEEFDLPDQESFSFAILSPDGTLLSGALPEWLAAVIDESRLFSTHFIRNNGKYYVYRIARIGPKGKNFCYVAGFIDIKKMDNVYHTISFGLICGEILTLSLILLLLFVFGRHISQTLTTVIENAQTIGVTTDFSRRIDNHVRFHELSILIDAHNRLLDRVEETLELHKEFGRNISHELRTPISIVQAQCQLMRDTHDNDAKFLKEIGVIERQNDRMRRMVNQLLSFFRLEAVGDNGDIEQVDLRDVILVICEDFEELTQREDLFSTDLEPVTVQANLNLLVTLFRNLISNTVKYGMSDRPIEISLHRAENQTVIAEIRDHGIGMPESELSKIFDAFYRIEKSRNAEGFGLGLTMAKRIAEYYSGRLQAESETGAGSLFRVELNFPN